MPTRSGDLSQELEGLFRDGVLVDLDIGVWTARKRNTAEDLDIENPGEESTIKIPEYIVGLGTKRLLPEEVTKTWTMPASHARTRLRKWSTLFPIGNGSFVPITALPTIEEALLADQAQFMAAAAAMLKEYDAHRDKMLAEYPDKAALLAQAFPPKAQIERAFYFTWSAYEIRVPKKISLAATNRERAERRLRHDAKREQIEREALTRYHRELEARMETFLADSVQKLRQRVALVCQNAAKQARANEIVTNKSLNVLRNALDFFRTMNFLNDSTTSEMLNRFEREYLKDKTADDFDDARLARTFADALDAITEHAQNATDVSEVTGEYRRRVIV